MPSGIITCKYVQVESKIYLIIFMHNNIQLFTVFLFFDTIVILLEHLPSILDYQDSIIFNFIHEIDKLYFSFPIFISAY
jgi:hypothetical protein